MRTARGKRIVEGIIPSVIYPNGPGKPMFSGFFINPRCDCGVLH